MKIFIDTANLVDIEEALRRGFAHGITTNPSLLAKEPKSSLAKHIGKIIELINKYQPGIHLSVEVFSRDPKTIIEQAHHMMNHFNYPQMSIKVQVGWDELETIKKLSKAGISVNCTACMNVTQAVMAARAGAKYVSLFWGRIRDGGLDEKMSKERDEAKNRRALDKNDFNPYKVVQATRRIFDQDKIPAEIIAGSMRGVIDVRDARLAGAHIVTVPPKYFPDMINHFKTEEVVNQFLSDFEKWLS